MAYGAMIRNWRKQKKMTQPELATAIGCTDGHISHMENENREPSEEICVALAREFELSDEDYQALVEAIEKVKAEKDAERRRIKKGSLLKAGQTRGEDAQKEEDDDVDVEILMQELVSDPKIAAQLPKLLAIFKSRKTRGNFLQFIDMYYKETQN